MLNCENASRLASKAMDEKLPLSESLALKIHLMLCRSCSNFTRQLNFLRAVIRYPKSRIRFRLEAEAKQRIAKVLDENSQHKK